jgi:hypothetical protein
VEVTFKEGEGSYALAAEAGRGRAIIFVKEETRKVGSRTQDSRQEKGEEQKKV